MYETGINLFNRDPAKTPRREDKTRAQAEPIKTCHTDPDFDASIIVDN